MRASETAIHSRNNGRSQYAALAHHPAAPRTVGRPGGGRGETRVLSSPLSRHALTSLALSTADDIARVALGLLLSQVVAEYELVEAQLLQLLLLDRDALLFPQRTLPARGLQDVLD